MSQQEFEKEHQQEVPAQPYYWSTRPQAEGTPKDEHPLNYGEQEYEYGYQSQEYSHTQKQQPHSRQQSFDQDGDAFERGYNRGRGRDYQAHASREWVVPPWAKPQRNNMRPLKFIIAIVLGILLIKPILIIGGIILATIAAIVGLALLAILIPVFLIILVSLPFVAYVLLQRPRYIGRWRSPWGWM